MEHNDHTLPPCISKLPTWANIGVIITAAYFLLFIASLHGIQFLPHNIRYDIVDSPFSMIGVVLYALLSIPVFVIALATLILLVMKARREPHVSIRFRLVLLSMAGVTLFFYMPLTIVLLISLGLSLHVLLHQVTSGL